MQFLPPELRALGDRGLLGLGKVNTVPPRSRRWLLGNGFLDVLSHPERGADTGS